ncbi:AMP-binding protein [Actinomadura opuntiae]|uniref:AMP-binding protein n=1 Tax=Actinomadura sp. OS1-43 TaxID=604315 RepID=UPI00255A7F8D|nr:AMP-binding protein [Actinomadura sp. OS1-43]MDL4816382.1 AMP-binding protein [Actinomadura sp. OS1-43]
MHHLGWQARRRPDAAAVIESDGTTVTYAELDARSRHLAAALDLDPGERISVQMPNGAALLEVAWAAQRSGLYYTPVNTHLRPSEIAEMTDGTLLVTTEVYERLLATPVGGGPRECEGRELLFSGGTTGRPKAIRKQLTAGPMGDPTAECVRVAMGLERYGLGPGSVYLSPAPLYHAAPLVYCMSLLRLGATLVVMDRFDAARCLELIERHRVTHAQFVPTMFIRMLKLPAEQRDRDLSSLELVFHSAAPCPVEVKRRMLDWFGPIIHEYYSGTEGYGHVAIGPEEWLAHPGSVGKAGDDVSIRDGVVHFGDRTLGDVGHLDEDGYLYLTDRVAHMIVSGGVNIYPQETENLLVMHPRVADAAVIGVPDPEMGERVLAVVEPADGQGGDELKDELLAYCRDRLAHYKCPRDVDFVPALPRDPSGKLRKALLREGYWQNHETRIV